ncbi:MAG: tol-pal system protein YbgF [Gammaproteobacteria bacterium]|nr:tol-pal system protein YbgF [Gammaproteobacteria bacterium]NNC97171.1 tol-pal system protein YbgF [Gammaproteobacteria bacterium]NNM13636.1 tol-pal system protein YbgF [Gammaproteobacteria bacterium]
MKKLLLISLCSLVYLSGCALGGSNEPDPVLLKLDELDARLDRVESVLNNQSLLELQNDNDNLTNQIRDLRNQIDNLVFSQESTVNRQKSQYQDLDKRLSAVESRPARRVVVASPESVNDQTSGAQTASGSERVAYQSAFDLLKGGKYADAAEGFESYLSQYPNGQLADNAYYWLGESHYITRKFEDALKSFAMVTEKYPQSRKIADAWLKLGYTHYEMKNFTDAKSALEKTMSGFPDSSAALLAKQRLDRINKEQG